MANLEYSKKYDFIEGFEDLGGNHRSNKIAQYALVMLKYEDYIGDGNCRLHTFYQIRMLKQKTYNYY